MPIVIPLSLLPLWLAFGVLWGHHSRFRNRQTFLAVALLTSLCLMAPLWDVTILLVHTAVAAVVLYGVSLGYREATMQYPMGALAEWAGWLG